MLLTLDNICKSFGDTVAVDRLSLQVPEGVIYGIVGPNGAGKTTTIRMIMNITIPDAGRVLIDGQPATSDFRNRVGYLPEERGLYKKMAVTEVLVYVAQLKGCSAQSQIVGEALLGFVLVVAAFAGMVWLTSKVFRIGILMYGKQPTLPEIIKWLKY